MKKTLFALTAAMLVLQSCVHIEKRHYRKGFHVEFIRKAKTSDQLFEENQVVQDKPADFIPIIVEIEPMPIQNTDKPIENEIISVEKESHLKPVTVALQPIPKEEQRVEQKTTFKPQKKTATDDKKASKEKGIFMAFGWILCVLGLIILIFASILAGILIMALGGLFFLLAAVTKTDKKKTNDSQPEYIDVVYLKNGSIIKGMIIEQTINVSLKIQTRDGSIFFYKMEEIEKIAKEKST